MSSLVILPNEFIADVTFLVKIPPENHHLCVICVMSGAPNLFMVCRDSLQAGLIQNVQEVQSSGVSKH